ncbi:MAG: hypothetical protein FWD13_10600, partial [Treponema sp.]|nr:hypothetical protein [Treponema sp.]
RLLSILAANKIHAPSRMFFSIISLLLGFGNFFLLLLTQSARRRDAELLFEILILNLRILE